MKTLVGQWATAATAGAVFCAVSGVGNVASAQEGQRIRIRMGDQAVTARLNNSEAARDFVAMLPLSLNMSDHLRREKTGHLPEPLSEQTRGIPTYVKGDLGSWRPGRNFVIFYLHDGLTIPSPGIVPSDKWTPVSRSSTFPGT
ncbi:MAG TPA: cyclophilin-like fold protein [Chthoniobacterales bacterium]|nr:cyclophilin-like fold protein [Chthoniobacterales bacterium]